MVSDVTSKNERDLDLAETFERLLGRQATAAEQANLLRVRDVLGLHKNDALWLVLLALESYDARYREYPQRIRNEIEQSAKELQSIIRTAGLEVLGHAQRVESAPSGGILRLALAACAGLVIFGAVCLAAGCNLAQGRAPPWLMGGGTTSPLGHVAGAVLRAPAGWMAFFLPLPFVITAARTGWRTSREQTRRPLERLAGFAILAGCVLIGVAALVILIGLL